MAAEREAKVVCRGDGRALWVVVSRLTLRVTGRDTGGAYTLWEDVVPPQGGPPPHVHRREDEAFYVAEGEMEFLVGGETVRVGPGAFVNAPRGIQHTFRNVGTGPATMAVVAVPSGIESFFEEVGTPATGLPGERAPEGPLDVERFVSIAAAYGIEIQAPRP